MYFNNNTIFLASIIPLADSINENNEIDLSKIKCKNINELNYQKPDNCCSCIYSNQLDNCIRIPSNAINTVICEASEAFNADPIDDVWEISAASWLEYSYGADWIWSNQDGTTSDTDETRYFCQDFNLPCNCSDAKLYIAADNRSKIWINNIPLSSNTWDTTLNWRNVNVIDIPCDPFLHIGMNVFRIQVGNISPAGGNAGVIWCLCVCCKACIANIDIDKKYMTQTLKAG